MPAAYELSRYPRSSLWITRRGTGRLCYSPAARTGGTAQHRPGNPVQRNPPPSRLTRRRGTPNTAACARAPYRPGTPKYLRTSSPAHQRSQHPSHLHVGTAPRSPAFYGPTPPNRAATASPTDPLLHRPYLQSRRHLSTTPPKDGDHHAHPPHELPPPHEPPPPPPTRHHLRHPPHHHSRNSRDPRHPHDHRLSRLSPPPPQPPPPPPNPQPPRQSAPAPNPP